MPKNRKSNKEAKTEPAMNMKEKRAAKKAKLEDKRLFGSLNATRNPAPVAKTKRS